MTTTTNDGVSVRRSLGGARVLVTGGTSGLGLALVRELAGRGATAAFVARTRARVEEVERSVPRAIGIVGDVSRKDDVHAIAIQAVGRLGGLDAVVHGASSLGPVPLRPLADTACEDLELALRTNLLGPFRLTKAVLGALASSARDGRGAVVVNVSSDAALTPYAGWGAYGASKAALHHLSRIWDAELGAAGVRVVAFDPGDMDTPLHALALPEADPSTLKRPEASAVELADLLSSHLPSARGRAAPERREATS